MCISFIWAFARDSVIMQPFSTDPLNFGLISHFCCSAKQGPVEHQVLPLPDQGRRLGVGPELPHHRPQLEVIEAPLHRQRQLRNQVTNTSIDGTEANSEKIDSQNLN